MCCLSAILQKSATSQEKPPKDPELCSLPLRISKVPLQNPLNPKFPGKGLFWVCLGWGGLFGGTWGYVCQAREHDNLQSANFCHHASGGNGKRLVAQSHANRVMNESVNPSTTVASNTLLA
eukprot:2218570-Amphidinium_carterae.1